MRTSIPNHASITWDPLSGKLHPCGRWWTLPWRLFLLGERSVPQLVYVNNSQQRQQLAEQVFRAIIVWMILHVILHHWALKRQLKLQLCMQTPLAGDRGSLLFRLVR